MKGPRPSRGGHYIEVFFKEMSTNFSVHTYISTEL